MKKFLTVLLALSVVFTYTFGSAGSVFANTSADQYAANVWKAAEQVTTTFNAAYENAVKNVEDTTTTAGYPISKGAWLSAAKIYHDAQVGLINARAEQLISLHEDLQDSTVTQLVAKFEVANGQELANGVNAGTKPPTLNSTDILREIMETSDNGSGPKDVAYRTAFGEYKQAILTAINGVDTSVYSNKAVSAADKTTSKEYVEKFIEEQKKIVNGVTITSKATAADVDTAFAKLGKIAERTYTAATGEADEIYSAYANGSNGTATGIATASFGKTYNIEDSSKQAMSYELTTNTVTVDGNSITVKTTAEDAVADESLAAKKASKKAALASELATLKEGIVTLTSATDKATAQEFAKNFETVKLYQIENATDSTINGINVAISGNTAADKAAHAKVAANDYAKANIKSYAALETYAKKLAAEVDDKGNVVRDEAKIQKVLDAAKAVYYVTDQKVTTTSLTVEGVNTDPATAEVLIEKNCYIVAEADAFTAAAAVEALKQQLDDLKLDKDNKSTTYYDKEYQEVKAIYDAQIAKIQAATTAKELEDATKYSEMNKAISKIDHADDVEGKIASWVSAAYDGGLSAYVEFVKAERNNETTFDAAYKALLDEDSTVNAASWNSWYAEQGARTEADVKNLYNAACAAVKALPTKSELDAEKTSVEGMITNLPPTITTADKDAVVAAKEALDDFYAKGGSGVKNEYSLNLKITALKSALTNEISKAVTALPRGENAKAENKEAFKAAMEKMEAYNKLTGTFGWSDKYAAGISQFDKVKKGLDTIKNAEKQAVLDAIDSLPINITAENKEAVEAARALYDAYVKEYSDPAAAVDARTDFSAQAGKKQIEELVAAEKALAKALEEENATVKIATAGTHVTINSKAGKGYIKISWGQKDNGVKLDGYEVYRSTKKNSGFKKISTFKVQKSKKYTKGMKKGTKYYFYVKGYKMVGDEKVYTHNSIKLYRTFR